MAGARAARTPQSQLLQAKKVLKHGLFARRLGGPVASLGENPREQKSLERRVMGYLAPQNASEEKLARQIAGALWRHHRLYFAEAAWEIERLRGFLAEAPRAEESSAELARLRAYALLEILLDREQSATHSWRLLGAAESLLRRFIRLRAAGDSKFRMGQRLITSRPSDRAHRADRELRELITDPDLRADLLEYDLATF